MLVFSILLCQFSLLLSKVISCKEFPSISSLSVYHVILYLPCWLCLYLEHEESPWLNLSPVQSIESCLYLGLYLHHWHSQQLQHTVLDILLLNLCSMLNINRYGCSMLDNGFPMTSNNSVLTPMHFKALSSGSNGMIAILCVGIVTTADVFILMMFVSHCVHTHVNNMKNFSCYMAWVRNRSIGPCWY